MQKIKKIISLILTSIPINCVRIFLLNLFFDYNISYKAKVGFLNILIAKNLSVGDNVVLLNRIYILAGSVTINSGTIIKSRTSINGCSKINFGDDCVVNGTHFDLAADISIGSNVVFGGKHTEVWTHGYDWARKKIIGPVRILDDVYIGSKSIINPGVLICSKSVIGSGTVISKSVNYEYKLITSNTQKERPFSDLINKGYKCYIDNGETVFEKNFR
ncbi:TPA: acyltransferase [Photobacterium damselae]